MKLCFSTLGCPGYGLNKIIDLAKSFNINAVELRGVGDSLLPSETAEFQSKNIKHSKELFLKNNIKPISLDLSYTCHTVGKNNSEIMALVPELLVASELNIPYIRVFGNNLSGDVDRAYKDIIYALKAACNLAAERGITVLLEIHGDFNSIERLEPIINEMKNEKAFGIIWDIAHSDREYGDNFEPFYEYIKPFIRHIHIKDHLRNPFILTEVGKGEIPVKKIVKRLINDGYDGYFSLEWEKRWVPRLSEIEVALKNFVSFMAEI